MAVSVASVLTGPSSLSCLLSFCGPVNALALCSPQQKELIHAGFFSFISYCLGRLKEEKKEGTYRPNNMKKEKCKPA
jgi:hypothetical protein